MAKHRRSSIPAALRLPPQVVPRLHPTASSEAEAARALQVERDRRGQECYVELMAVLDRHRCTLQVVTQEIQVVGRPEVSRVTQVNILPLDTPPAPIPQAVADPGQNGKPAG